MASPMTRWDPSPPLLKILFENTMKVGIKEIKEIIYSEYKKFNNFIVKKTVVTKHIFVVINRPLLLPPPPITGRIQ